jgi:hypothetical protein
MHLVSVVRKSTTKTINKSAEAIPRVTRIDVFNRLFFLQGTDDSKSHPQERVARLELIGI